MKKMVDRWRANGSRCTSAFMHMKAGYTFDDLWNLRNALMFDMAEGHPYTIGPRKSRDDLMIDMEIANTFKAICWLRCVEFEFKERNQATQAIAVGVKRGYVKNQAVWVDGIKIAAWNWETNEVDLCDESMMDIADMTRQEIMRAIKALAVKRVERMKASKAAGH